MGICECINRENNSQKTVDIKSLKNDLKTIEKEPRTAPKNFKDKTSEISHLNEIKPKEEKENYFNPSQNSVICTSNHTENRPGIISDQIQEPMNKDNNQFLLHERQKQQHQPQMQYSSLSNLNQCQEESNDNHKSEAIIDAKVMSTKEAVLRFLNRTYINIVILGGVGVGKSAFVIKFIENVFEKLYIPTLGSEVRRKKYLYNTHLYDLNFTVTAGKDYKTDYSKAYQAVDFFLAFYDITSLESFNEAQKILKSDVKNYVCFYEPAMTNVFFVGNKIDCSPRTVSEQVAKAFCLENYFQMFDISVKTNKNIATMMKNLIKTVDDIAYPS